MHPNALDTAGTIRLTFKVSKEAAEAIISTALDQGNWEWLHEVERAKPLDPDDPKFEQDLSEAFAYDGQALRFYHPVLDGRTYNDLTMDKLVAGLAQYIEEGGSMGLLLRNDSDAPADVTDCDFVLQYALFTTYAFD